MAENGSGWGLEFYESILNNDLPKLESLVEQHKIDLNAKFTEVREKNHLDLSPIHLVCYKGFTGMLQYLIDSNADVHLSTATLRRTAFHFAVLHHKMACFNKLMQIGVNPDPRDTFGNSPCHYAAEDGDSEILDKLLLKCIDANAQDITLKTPLMKATRNGKIQAVKRLIKTGCALNIRDKNGDTALHFAARHGSANLVVILIEAGSDVNVQNQWGRTPLIEAVCYNNKEAAVRLLSANCDVNKREFKSGDTALHVAARKNYTELVERLLLTGKVAHSYNNQGESAVYEAVVNNKMDTVRYFIRYNYDLDVPGKIDFDGSGRSLIRLALLRSNYEMCRLLLSIGCHLSPASLVGEPKQQPVDRDYANALNHFLREIDCVRSLKQICRKGLRKCLKFGITSKVNMLPLPLTLKDYVLAKDIT